MYIQHARTDRLIAPGVGIGDSSEEHQRSAAALMSVPTTGAIHSGRRMAHGSFNASTQGFSWRETDGTLRLTSNENLCVTYLGHNSANVGLAVCQEPAPWTEPGIGAQVWKLSNTSSNSTGGAGASSFVYLDYTHGAVDTGRCFNVAGCDTSGHSFEVGPDCALEPPPPPPPPPTAVAALRGGAGDDSGGGCDQRWRMEGGVLRTAIDDYKSCLTLGNPVAAAA